MSPTSPISCRQCLHLPLYCNRQTWVTPRLSASTNFWLTGSNSSPIKPACATSSLTISTRPKPSCKRCGPPHNDPNGLASDSRHLLREDVLNVFPGLGFSFEKDGTLIMGQPEDHLRHRPHEGMRADHDQLPTVWVCEGGRVLPHADDVVRYF